MLRRMPRYATTLCLLGLLAASSAFAQNSVCSQVLPIGLLPPAGGWTTDCAHRVSLKLGASIGAGGNYIMITYPTCASGPCAGQGGTTALQCQATSGYSCCVNVSDVEPTITGTNIGFLVSGLNSRIAADTDTRSGICYSAYTGNGSRVASAPVTTLSADRSSMTVTGFALLFITGPPVGTGNATVLPVEFLPTGVVPAHASTWGGLKMLYR
jgi:hypothetical protein